MARFFALYFAHSFISIDTLNINLGAFGTIATFLLFILFLTNKTIRKLAKSIYKSIKATIPKLKAREK